MNTKDDWLKPTYACAAQLLLQATLAGITRNRDLALDIVERGVKAGILEMQEREEDGEVKMTIRVKESNNDN